MASGEQADMILRIPFARSRLPNLVIWRYDFTSCYSVKSGYMLLILKKHSIYANYPLMPIALKHFYRSLWDLHLPSKLKIHCQRLYNNFLPTFSNLNLRHLRTNYMCPLCGVPSETVDHIVHSYSVTRELLSLLKVDLLHPDTCPNYSTWMEQLFQIASTDQRQVLVVTWVAL